MYCTLKRVVQKDLFSLLFPLLQNRGFGVMVVCISVQCKYQCIENPNKGTVCYVAALQPDRDSEEDLFLLMLLCAEDTV